MASDISALIHGFELKPPRWVAEDGVLIERITSGNDMSADKRETLPYVGEHGHDPSLIVTGSHAFLDFRTIGVLQSVPPVAFPRTAIQVLRIGVEPDRLHKGYGLALVEYLAAIATGRSINYLVCTGNTEQFPHLRAFDQLGFVAQWSFIRPGTLLNNLHHYPIDDKTRDRDFFPLYAPLPLQIPELPK